MSYDLQIWSVRPVQAGTGRVVPGKGWQIVINESDKVLPEDIEKEISALLPGISYLTELNLEGSRTQAAKKLLASTAKEEAKRAHGVACDPQTDRVSTPSGIVRYVRPKKERTFSILRMSWWFLNDLLLTGSGRRAFLTLLQKSFPEAMPKRYGDYEPPQFVFAKTGMSHLNQCIGRNLDFGLVWYPNRPATGVTLSCPEPLGGSDRGFRTHLVEIELELSALTQPGWAEQMRLLWHEMTFLLRPIYGDVRTEGGFSRSGGTVYHSIDALKESFNDVTRSWFWRGIPRKLGSAVVLGKEYQRLWPAFKKNAIMKKGFVFASTNDWLKKEDVGKIVGLAPKPITLLPGSGMGLGQKYPPVWPFDPPFGSAR